MKYLLAIFILSCGILGCTQPANAPLTDLAELQQQLADIQDYIDSGNCTNETGRKKIL